MIEKLAISRLVKKSRRISRNPKIHHRNKKTATGPIFEQDHSRRHPSTYNNIYSSISLPTWAGSHGLPNSLRVSYRISLQYKPHALPISFSFTGDKQ
jgi:hypothetical protein